MSIAREENQQQPKQETFRFPADPVVNDKVKLALKGLSQPSIQRLFLEFLTDQDKELVADGVSMFPSASFISRSLLH